MNRRHLVLAVAMATSLVAAGCSSDGGSDGAEKVALTLVAYDSFPTKDTPLNDALAEFTADTGIDVSIVIAGDAGTMVTKAVLTAGNPEGDVLWGVDNTLLSAATDGGIFDGAPAQVDFGDVCVNYDIAWFAEHGIDPPATLDDLLLPEYNDLLVVQNPATRRSLYPPRTDSPTGVAAATCFRQLEYAGTLRGTRHPVEASRLLDFLVSERFQRELPLNLYVYPVNTDVVLPDAFTEYAVVPDDPFTLDPATIAANREQWQDQWNEIVLR